MKTFLLSAALLLPFASAQVAIPATPIPAKPAATTAPTTTAPATTTPATTTPAAAPVLNLSAAVGTGVELQTTTVSRMTVSDMQVTALPGSDLSAEELAQIRGAMSEGMAGAGAGKASAVSGKLFYRVTARGADGSVTLLSSVVQSVPGQPPVSLKITQTLARDGKVSGLKFESDNPTLKAAFSGLSGDKLEQLADQNGANFAGVYGQPLLQGQPRSQTVTLDASSILSGVLSSFASQSDAPDLFGQVQSTPLSVTTTTTYGGINAQGLYSFASSSKYDRWNINLGGAAGSSSPFSAFDIELTEGQATGTQTYRKDGLPGPTTQNLRMVMKMAIEIEGVRISLTMTIDQSVTAKLR